MGGLGSEFAEAGFRMPKPLVNIVGRPVSSLFSGMFGVCCFRDPVITFLTAQNIYTFVPVPFCAA